LAPLRRLLRDHSVEEALAVVSEPVLPDPPLCGDRAWIDASYGAASVSAILHALDGRPEDAARAAADRIRQLPPLALCVTLRGLARARELGRLSDVLVQDYRMCCRFLEGRDVREGVRAAVIDKSATPAWHPPRLQDVTEAVVERHFAPLGTDDLDVGRGVRASPE
jgi:enoyl-CoA hydratase